MQIRKSRKGRDIPLYGVDRHFAGRALVCIGIFRIYVADIEPTSNLRVFALMSPRITFFGPLINLSILVA